jgi:ABC-type transport system involved in multi-copper enzyme maturation permease subunit
MSAPAKADRKVAAREKEPKVPSRFKIIYDIVRKEVKEHFSTKRLIIFAVIFAVVFSVVAVYGNIIGGGGSTDRTWEDGPNNTLKIVLNFSSFLPSIISIAMTYNAISGERGKKSLILLLSKPIDRSSVYIGKFLSSFMAISIVYFLVMIVGYGISAGLYGKAVSAGDVGRAFGGIAIVLFGIATWIALTLFFSTILRNPTTNIVIMVILWLFVLPLVSQIGLIYFAVDSSNQMESQPVNVDVTIASTSFLPPYDDIVFNTSKLDMPIAGVAITLVNETGQPYEKKLPFEGPQTIFIDVPPGRYTWTAETEVEEDSREEPEFIEEGSLVIDTGHMVYSNISADKDRLYNDFNIIVLNGTWPDLNATVTVRDSGGAVISANASLFGIYQFSDLDRGRYTVEVVSDNIAIYKDTFFSYGDFESTNFLAILMGDKEDLPNYVSYSYAINPDSDMAVAVDYVEDQEGSLSFNLLEVKQGLAALGIWFSTMFILGLIAFERKDPN